MSAHSFFDFNQDVHGDRRTLAGRLGAQIRVAAVAYPALAAITFAVATGAALINPDLLKPIVTPAPIAPAPQLSPTAQDCLDRADREIKGTNVEPNLRRGIQYLIALSCLDRALTAQAAEPPGTSSPH